ncbi:MAG: GTP cyclohydrolase I FolE2 [Candidatus Heimdallarchaeota archaeon]|nr:MAG: GTP cyclohydrolase I FolE2 [Candidatus Heimdallarchaeota archaeon]
MEKETQDQIPVISLSLDEVGVTDFQTQVSITRGTKIYRYQPTVSVVINLPPSRKGAHLSRFVESISEILSSEVQVHYSLEEMSVHVLKKLNERHPFEKGSISLEFIFFTTRTTPVSRRSSLENYNAHLTTWLDKEEILHQLTLGTYGSTACPHALSQNPTHYTHIQRAYAEISLKGPTPNIPDMEDVSVILDKSFSAPTFSLLKTEDEQWVVNQMWENPLFVEDVTRNLLQLASKHFSDQKLEIRAKTVSQESIHKHNIMSKGSIRNSDYGSDI